MQNLKATVTAAMLLATIVGAAPVQNVEAETGLPKVRRVDASPEDVFLFSNGTVTSCMDAKAKGKCSHPLAKNHCRQACGDELQEGEDRGQGHEIRFKKDCRVSYSCSPGNCFGSFGCDCPGSCCTNTHGFCI